MTTLLSLQSCFHTADPNLLKIKLEEEVKACNKCVAFTHLSENVLISVPGMIVKLSSQEVLQSGLWNFYFSRHAGWSWHNGKTKPNKFNILSYLFQIAWLAHFKSWHRTRFIQNTSALFTCYSSHQRMGGKWTVPASPTATTRLTNHAPDTCMLTWTSAKGTRVLYIV